MANVLTISFGVQVTIAAKLSFIIWCKGTNSGVSKCYYLQKYIDKLILRFFICRLSSCPACLNVTTQPILTPFPYPILPPIPPPLISTGTCLC